MVEENYMIKLVNVNKSFGDLHVLKDINLSISEIQISRSTARRVSP